MNLEIKEYLSSQDPILAEVIEKVKLPDLQSSGDVFHDLMSCIIEQQIHYRSSKKQFQKLLTQAGLKRLTLENFTIFEKKALSSLKLSMRKLETMERVLGFFHENKPKWQEMQDAEIRNLFTTLKGIGPWTVDMLLLYTLRRPDVFSADDFHIKQIMTQVYEIESKSKLKARLLEIAEHWTPYRSYGTRYLLAYKEALKKGLI